jgi:RNA polymerase sigma-70 factor (ECF subfamily)
MIQNGIIGKNIAEKVPLRTMLSHPLPEETISSFNINNRETFTAIYNKLFPYAFFFANKIAGNLNAADIVASVFYKLWLQKKKFENLAHIKAYLRVSVRNACISHFRKESSRLRREERGYSELYGDGIDNCFLKEEIGAEKLHLIFTEIEKFPARSKEIFKLAYLDNLKNAEIARRLGITVRTVQNQKSSTLKILRMSLLTKPFLLLYTGLHLLPCWMTNISAVL